MKTHLVVLTFSSLAIQIANSQLLSLLVDALNPVYEFFSDSNYHDRVIQSNPNGQLIPGGIDPGTPIPQATGFDELFRRIVDDIHMMELGNYVFRTDSCANKVSSHQKMCCSVKHFESNTT